MVVRDLGGEDRTGSYVTDLRWEAPGGWCKAKPVAEAPQLPQGRFSVFCPHLSLLPQKVASCLDSTSIAVGLGQVPRGPASIDDKLSSTHGFGCHSLVAVQSVWSG
jgi:hypothetical protein